jgi:hypothetical protein
LEQQKQTFRHCGFTVECELEAMLSPGVFCFYFIPIPSDNPTDWNLSGEGSAEGRCAYLCVPLSVQSWTRLSMTHLEAFPTLPKQLEAYHVTELWARFWADLVIASNGDLRSHRGHLTSLCLWVMVMLFPPHVFNIAPFGDYTSLLIYATYILFALYLWVQYRSAHFRTAMNQRRDLIQRYACEFAAHGLLTECRSVHEPGFGSYIVHYLYVFPIETHPSATV